MNEGMGKVFKAAMAAIRTLPTSRRWEAISAATENLHEVAYARLAQADFAPAAIIDVGAFQGDRATEIARFFPPVPILMIEAQADQERYLNDTVRNLKKAKYGIPLLASEDGKFVPSNVMGPAL